MNIFEEFKEKVKSANPILELIAEYLSVKNNKALCPFHEEDTPSFSINPRGGYCHCFGCGAGGDVIAFVMLYFKKTFWEAVIFLANRGGIPVLELRPENQAQIEEDRCIQDILSDTAVFYHRSLTPEVRQYLYNRGVTDETIDRFNLGYAGGGLREYLLNAKGFRKDLCVRAKVLIENNDGVVKDRFYKRVLFPNMKRREVVNISGRSLDNSEPKYLHLPGELEHLFNEDALLDHKIVFLSEGAPDCLTLEQNGYPSVAVLGAKNFKPNDTGKFSRCETVYLCLDPDPAGKEGALKIARMLLDKAKIIELPEGLDINDYFKTHTKEEFDRLIEVARDLIEYSIEQIPSDVPKTKLPALIDNALRLLAEMDKAKAEPYLAYVIKPRFSLKDPDIRGYRDLVNKYRGQMTKDNKSNDSKETVLTAEHENLIDIVEDEGRPVFLLKTDEGITIVPEIDEDKVTCVPPPREQLPWLLCSAQEVMRIYEEEKQLSVEEVNRNLFDALVDHYKSISQLPDEEHYYLLAAWIMHTYLLEQFQYTPIICLYAVPERGKSRTGKGLVHVAYRGIHVESLRDAYLVRVANNLKATLFFDVMNIWQKAEKNQSEDILLHRFEKGAQVPRVLYPEKGAHRDITYYSIFGPTIIGTNETIHRILETRAVNINMPETSRKFENSVTPELAVPLKCRLLVFRARHLNDTLPDMPKPAAGRLGDILKPLLQIIRFVRPEREDNFMALVSGFEAERLIEKADSLEAQILNALMSLKDQVAHGILPVKAITDRFNEGKHEKIKVTYQRIGRRLTAMGFKKARGDDGAAVVLWDDDMITRLMERYGLKETSETSERPETSTPKTGVPDVSDETDVFSDTYKD